MKLKFNYVSFLTRRYGLRCKSLCCKSLEISLTRAKMGFNLASKADLDLFFDTWVFVWGKSGYKIRKMWLKIRVKILTSRSRNRVPIRLFSISARRDAMIMCSSLFLPELKFCFNCNLAFYWHPINCHHSLNLRISDYFEEKMLNFVHFTAKCFILLQNASFFRGQQNEILLLLPLV